MGTWTPMSRVLELTQNSPPPIPDSAKPKAWRIFAHCANCNAWTLLPRNDSAGRAFCSSTCREWFNGPKGFCAECLAQTTDESSGNLFRFNGIGYSFVGRSNKCPNCASIVQRRVVTLFFLPLIPAGKFRVLYPAAGSLLNSRFYSRRVKVS